MTKPTRIQRKRTKGWRAPEGTVMCTRPGPLGNPWRVTCSGKQWIVVWPEGKEDRYPTKALATRMALHMFRMWLRYPMARARFRVATRGAQHLACWCALGSPCHVDIILDEIFGDP